MVCSNCKNRITDGWATGSGRVCQPCVDEALAIAEGHVRNQRAFGWIRLIHALAHYGHPMDACPVCVQEARA